MFEIALNLLVIANQNKRNGVLIPCPNDSNSIAYPTLKTAFSNFFNSETVRGKTGLQRIFNFFIRLLNQLLKSGLSSLKELPEFWLVNKCHFFIRDLR